MAAAISAVRRRKQGCEAVAGVARKTDMRAATQQTQTNRCYARDTSTQRLLRQRRDAMSRAICCAGKHIVFV